MFHAKLNLKICFEIFITFESVIDVIKSKLYKLQIKQIKEDKLKIRSSRWLERMIKRKKNNKFFSLSFLIGIMILFYNLIVCQKNIYLGSLKATVMSKKASFILGHPGGATTISHYFVHCVITVGNAATKIPVTKGCDFCRDPTRHATKSVHYFIIDCFHTKSPKSHDHPLYKIDISMSKSRFSY